MNNIAIAITAIIILALSWGAQAKVSIITVSLLFFFLSALQHLREAIRLKKEQSKRQKIHWQRVALSAMLCVATLPLIYPFYAL